MWTALILALACQGDAAPPISLVLYESVVVGVPPDVTLVAPSDEHLKRSVDACKAAGIPCFLAWPGQGTGLEDELAVERSAAERSTRLGIALRAPAREDGATVLRVPLQSAETSAKEPDELASYWYKSVAVGGRLEFAVGPGSDGRFADAEIERLAAFGRWNRRLFRRDALAAAVALGGATHGASDVRSGERTFDATSLLDPRRTTTWSVSDGHDAEGAALAWVEFRLPEPLAFDHVWLEEPLASGGRIQRFHISVEDGDGWKDIARGEEIGVRRVLRVTPQIARRIRVTVGGAEGTPSLSRLSLFMSPPTVKVAPPSAMSLNPVMLTLTSAPGASIRYTLDGSEPSKASPLYDGPLRLTTTATVRALAFDAGGPGLEESTAEIHIVEESEWRVGLQFIKAPDPGLVVEAFEGIWSTVSDIEGKAAVTMKNVGGISVKRHASRDEQAALRYRGYVQVPQDGLFTFALVSDDGSRLSIHGELLVDNDGVHAPRRASAKVPLRQGWHPIEVLWFNARGPGSLEVRWSGPGVGRDELIPNSALFR